MKDNHLIRKGADTRGSQTFETTSPMWVRLDNELKERMLQHPACKGGSKSHFLNLAVLYFLDYCDSKQFE